MKVEISLTPKYVEDWGIWEGIRELLQNAKDGESEKNAPMTVAVDGNDLIIKNEGVTLPKEALLIGFSDKGTETSIGQFGEGLKLGILALCRSGYKVKIENGGEIWTPYIDRSSKYDSDVLIFETKKRQAKSPKEDLKVRVFDVADEWGEIKENFLFLNPPQNQISTEFGSLILDEEYAGRVFVKGIYVTDLELKYSYDLTSDVRVDRDRKLVTAADSNIARIWDQAVSLYPHLTNNLFDLLEEADKYRKETQSMWLWITHSKALANKFLEKHGENAVPVKGMWESKEIGGFGKEGIIVHRTFGEVLRKEFGTYTNVLEKAANIAASPVSWNQLSDNEKTNLDEALTISKLELPFISLDMFIIAEFPSNIFGQNRNGRILLSRSHLSEVSTTLATIIHEVMHNYNGGDMDTSHRISVEECLGKVAVKAWNRR